MKKHGKLKIIIMFVVAIYISYILIMQQLTMKRQKAELELLNNRFLKVKEENLLLKDKMNIIDDPKYTERMAREIFGLIKDGEIPIINIDEDNDESEKK